MQKFLLELEHSSPLVRTAFILLRRQVPEDETIERAQTFPATSLLADLQTNETSLARKMAMRRTAATDWPTDGLDDCSGLIRRCDARVGVAVRFVIVVRSVSSAEGS